MEIQHQKQNNQGVFFIANEDGEHLASMTYIMDTPTIMRIEHTTVSEQLAGQGVGKKSVEAGVNFAREHQYKIIPACSYARALIEKTETYHDVWQRDV